MIPTFESIQSDSGHNFIDRIYRNSYKLAAYQLFQIVKDPHVIADLLQDTFVRLIPKIDLLQTLSENQLRVYISQTAKHTALDYMRKKHVRDKWTYYPEETSPEPADNADTPEEAFLKQERREEIQCAMDKLSERDRDLLYFKYRLDLSAPDICRAMGISSLKVSIRLCPKRENGCARSWSGRAVSLTEKEKLLEQKEEAMSRLACLDYEDTGRAFYKISIFALHKFL